MNDFAVTKLEAKILPVEEIEFPKLYKGEKISENRTKQLINSTKRRKLDVKGLVFHPGKQNFSREKQKRLWKHVITRPTKRQKLENPEKAAYEINTPEGLQKDKSLYIFVTTNSIKR